MCCCQTRSAWWLWNKPTSAECLHHAALTCCCAENHVPACISSFLLNISNFELIICNELSDRWWMPSLSPSSVSNDYTYFLQKIQTVKTKCFKISTENWFITIHCCLWNTLVTEFPFIWKISSSSEAFSSELFSQAFLQHPVLLTAPEVQHLLTSVSCTPVIESRVLSVICKVCWMDKTLQWLKR